MRLEPHFGPDYRIHQTDIALRLHSKPSSYTLVRHCKYNGWITLFHLGRSHRHTLFWRMVLAISPN